MPDTDLRQTPETDWAQRLKQQMERQDEPPAAAREPDDAQDELESLLREQLSRLQTGSTATAAPAEQKPEPEPAPAPAEPEPPAEPESPAEPEPPAELEPEPTLAPTAPDDELNGVPVAELLDSGAFLQGLDPDVCRRIRAVWDSPAAPLEAEAPAAEPLPADNPPPEPEAQIPQPQASPAPEQPAASAPDRTGCRAEPVGGRAPAG